MNEIETFFKSIHVQVSQENQIIGYLLENIKRELYEIFISNINKKNIKNPIFKFFYKKQIKNMHQMQMKKNLFLTLQGIFIFEYLQKHYFVIWKNEKDSFITRRVNFEFRINLVFSDISSKYKNSVSLMFISFSSEGVLIYRYLISNLKENEELNFYSKIVIHKCFKENNNFNKFLENLKQEENNTKNNFNEFINENTINCNKSFSSIISINSFREFESSYFALIVNNNIYLFEKFEKQSILIQTSDISFMENSFPLNLSFTNYEIENFKSSNNTNNVINNHLNKDYYISDSKDYFYILSSNKFLYKINLKNRSNNNEYLPIFKDITLNFNNNKYIELLKSLKIIILYNLEIQKIEFKDLKKYMKNIFHQYDIYSYVENIQDVLSFENVIFFINYNFNSSKIYVVILFCLIFDKFLFLRKIFNLLLSMDNYINFSTEKKDLNGLIVSEYNSKKQNPFYLSVDHLVENFNLNKEFVFYIICFLDFFKEFSYEFENYNFLPQVDEFFKKILDDSNQNNMRLLYIFIKNYLFS